MERTTIARLAGSGLSVKGAVLIELKVSYHTENTFVKKILPTPPLTAKHMQYFYIKN